RTPVAWGLRKQLELLKQYGYEVVTVKELAEESPFTDLGRDDPLFEKLAELQKHRAIVYSDNRLRLSDPMTVGELAMLLAPRSEAIERRHRCIREEKKSQHAYCGAMEYCRKQGIFTSSAKIDDKVTKLPEGYFKPTTDFTRRGVYEAYTGKMD
ncbi:MAG: hypothetical protein IKB58_03525, partial [Oscillospiraceae bacterium]|nr:hypothetical protein [Oscillospiraceae bacterium]